MAGGAPSVLVASGDKVEQGRIVSALQARQLAVDAVGDTASARERLETALAINPYWHPSQPDTARALLDSLAR